MVSHLIIGAILFGLTFFGLGVSGIVDYTKIPFINQIPQQTPNPNIELNVSDIGIGTDTSTPFDVGKWLTSVPTQDVANYLWSGVAGILRWLNEGLINGIAWVIRLIVPSAQVPSWISLVVFAILLIMFLYFSWDAIWELMHKSITIGLIIIFVILAVAITLILLGLI